MRAAATHTHTHRTETDAEGEKLVSWTSQPIPVLLPVVSVQSHGCENFLHRVAKRLKVADNAIVTSNYQLSTENFMPDL